MSTQTQQEKDLEGMRKAARELYGEGSCVPIYQSDVTWWLAACKYAREAIEKEKSP